MLTPTHLTTFPKFPSLPTELQLKIFRAASSSQPRTIDIWTDWKKCSQSNTIFYIQHYTCELSPLASTPPPLLSVSRAARSECLNSYTREFRCTMSISRDVAATMPATMWINFEIDTLVPRGFWNIVSFEDFARRVEGRLRSVAVDVRSCFWKDNLRDYCRKRCWVLNGVREVLLYDSMGEALFKGSEYLDKFRKREVGKRDLSFVELEGDGDRETEEVSKLKDIQTFLLKVFDVIEGKGNVDEDDEFGAVRKAEFISMEPTMKGEFKRPLVKLVKMVTSTPEERV